MSILRLKEENAELKRQITYLRKKIRTLLGNDIRSDVEKIKEVVNRYFNLEIDTRSRQAELIKARCVYFAFLRNNTDLSLKGIARTLELNFDHSTIIFQLKQHENFMLFSKQYKRQYNEVESLINLEISHEQREANNN